MKGTHPNQLTDTEISLIILSSTWKSAAFLYFKTIRKVAYFFNKNLSFKSALLVLTVSTNAFHLANIYLFLILLFLVVVFPLYFLYINTHTTHNSSIRSDEGLTPETSALKFFTVSKSSQSIKTKIT